MRKQNKTNQKKKKKKKATSIGVVVCVWPTKYKKILTWSGTRGEYPMSFAARAQLNTLHVVTMRMRLGVISRGGNPRGARYFIANWMANARWRTREAGSLPTGLERGREGWERREV